jgi:formylglycine-generating enzyme required for sulfatase activity
LEDTLRELQQGGWQGPTFPPEVATYLRRLRARIGSVTLFHSDQFDRAPLDHVYTPLNTDLSLSIDVHEHRIQRWWLALQTEGAAGASESSLNEAALVDQSSVDTLARVVQGLIDQGIDSEYDDASSRPLILAPPWYDGVKAHFWPVSATDAASVYRRLIVVGPPGSGKSTFARYLSLCMVDLALKSKIADQQAQAMLSWTHGALLPVYVELRRLFSTNELGRGPGVTEEAFWSYVRSSLPGDDDANVAPAVRRQLLDGRGLVILDGLDEVPVAPGEENLRARRAQIRDLTEELATVYPSVRILLTCRDYAYRDWALPGFASVRLSPLSLRQSSRMIGRLSRQRGVSPAQAEEDATTLLKALEQVPSALKDYPLFLALMTALFWQGGQRRLPGKRAALYGESIALLLNRWTRSDLDDDSLIDQLGCSLDALQDRLEKIAYETHLTASASDRSETEIDFRTLVTELFRMGEGVQAHKVLAFLTQQAGVIIAREPEIFQFAHRGFQEYLAARFLHRSFAAFLDRTRGDEEFTTVRNHIESSPLLWREPCLLLGEIICLGRRPGDVWHLIDSLLAGAQGQNDSRRGAWSTWLAARIVSDNQLNGAAAGLAVRTIVEHLREKLVDALTAPELGTHERVDVATTLGLIGDPRKGVGVTDGTPDIVWCDVPSGEFTLGTLIAQSDAIATRPWARGWKFGREMPASTIFVPAFRISMYPITQAQFRAFVDAPDGYQDDQWWLPFGLVWRNKAPAPGRAEWGVLPNLPQTNISWYEATAFCNWLGHRLRLPVRLPTEAEWERAAKWPSDNVFPWGDEFDGRMCNSSSAGFNRPIPVGCLDWETTKPPSPRDLCGNVWEWCSTMAESPSGASYGYPYDPRDGREDVGTGDGTYRIVRGGSYLNPPFLVRSAYRGRDLQDQRLSRSGFRIVVGSSKEVS